MGRMDGRPSLASTPSCRIGAQADHLPQVGLLSGYSQRVTTDEIRVKLAYTKKDRAQPEQEPVSWASCAPCGRGIR